MAAKCCVCGKTKGVSVFKGVGGDKFNVCGTCHDTLEFIDDGMDEGRAATIKEAKLVMRKGTYNF